MRTNLEPRSDLESGPFLDTFLDDVYTVASDLRRTAIDEFVRGAAGFVGWVLFGCVVVGSTVTDVDPSEAGTKILLGAAGWMFGALLVGAVLLWATTPRKIRRNLFPKRWDVTEIFNKGSSEEIVRFISVWALAPLWAGPAYVLGVSHGVLWVTGAVCTWTLGAMVTPFRGIYRRGSRIVRAFRDVFFGKHPTEGA